METDKLYQIACEKNLHIKDLKITEIVPNVIDNVIINIVDNKCEIYLPPMTGIDYKKWKNGRGGIFSRDLIKYLLDKPYGQYVLLKENKEKKIIRLIEDDEIEIFETLKLIDGKIKDKPFMNLRYITKGESLTKSNRYIEHIEEEPKMVILNIPSVSEDSGHHRDSISLFD